MAVTSSVKPSAPARSLFSAMVVRADDENLHLPLEATLTLAVERKRAGKSDTQEIYELLSEGWLRRAEDGGWLLS